MSSCLSLDEVQKVHNRMPLAVEDFPFPIWSRFIANSNILRSDWRSIDVSAEYDRLLCKCLRSTDRMAIIVCTHGHKKSPLTPILLSAEDDGEDF